MLQCYKWMPPCQERKTGKRPVSGSVCFSQLTARCVIKSFAYFSFCLLFRLRISNLKEAQVIVVLLKRLPANPGHANFPSITKARPTINVFIWTNHRQASSLGVQQKLTQVVVIMLEVEDIMEIAR